MNKQNRVSIWRTGVAVCFLLWMSFFQPVSTAADEKDLRFENLEFDSNGNLLMTTYDKKAGSNVRYKTIGWTVKRLPEDVSSTQRTRIKLVQNGESRTDPYRPGYVYTDFKCDRMLIFAKIGATSEEWQKELYQNGGMVYLDAIMTVVENGKQMGYLDENGVLHGEVYTSANGIMHARDWADPQGLLTHYNKAVYVPPVPDLFPPKYGEDHKEMMKLCYGKTECEAKNTVRIQAIPLQEPQYDVTKGIPTGEHVVVNGELQKYYYECELAHYYGTVSVPVDIEVTYTYVIQEEDGPVSGTYSCQYTYNAVRPYSYYRIEQLDVFELDRVFVKNDALPASPLQFTDMYEMTLQLERNRDIYMKIPSCQTSVYGGDISDGVGISSERLAEIAEAAAGNVWVRNDEWIIDGELILDGSFAQCRTREPVRQQGERLHSLIGKQATIPHTKQNGHYETYAQAFYRNTSDLRTERQDIKHVNEVVVHTPVVCKGGITDDIAHNQQIVPTRYLSLVLGRNFTVGISTVGQHKDQPGYGIRDYDIFVMRRQISFPFEVYDGVVRYAKNTWIELPSEGKSFYLPVGVHEGDYLIRYRTIAKNAESGSGCIDKNGYLANEELPEYGAYDELKVTIVGRMYDLAISDIVDYPRWKHVFYKPDGRKRCFAYWVGRKNLEGDLAVERKTDGIFPILAGDHMINPTAGAVGLGYRVKLQVKTIGDMRGREDHIVLIPTYYLISRDGTQRRQVRIYRKQDLSEVYQILTLSEKNRLFIPVETRNVADPLLCAQSVQLWEGEYQLSADSKLVDAAIDLNSYIQKRGGRISMADPVFLKDGYLMVQFEVQSVASFVPHLSYINSANAQGGYCNMWKLQGFEYLRKDRHGNRFCFTDGDCLLFDVRHTLYRDYESWGTH